MGGPEAGEKEVLSVSSGFFGFFVLMAVAGYLLWI
jgi:hypothetical protein